MTADAPTGSFDQEISIDAPQADIHSFLAAPEGIPEYWPGMALSEANEATPLAYAPPPEAVIPPLTLSVVPEVSEQNAPTSLTMAFEGELEGTVTWQLQETRGSTQVRVAAAYTSVGAAGEAPSEIPVRNGDEPLAPLQESLPGVLTEALATLKQLCEHPSPPAQMVATVEIPDIYCPFEPVLHPAAEDVVAHSMEWAQEMGLIDQPTPVHRSLARFASYFYPSASFTKCCLVSDWFVCVFLMDDDLDPSSQGTHPATTKHYHMPLLKLLEGEPVGESPSPVARAFSDLLQRIEGSCTPFLYECFVQHWEDYFTGQQWEAHNRAHTHVPSRDIYCRLRRKSVAADVVSDFVALQSDLAVTPSLYHSDTYQDILTSIHNVWGWTNDVCSLGKELADDEVNNLVIVIRNDRNCSFEEALSEACEMISEETKRFEALCQQLLEERGNSEALQSHLTDLSKSVVANLTWSKQAARYGHAE